MTTQVPALIGIRTGAHPDFDRVVLDFGPGPQPTFTQQQVDDLTWQGRTMLMRARELGAAGSP